MESIAALVIAAVCTGGAFLVGASYGRDKAYDEAFDNAVKIVNEVYQEELQ